MNGVYDIFEKRDDGDHWRASVQGFENIGPKIAEIGKQTHNECFAMHIFTREIVDRVNANNSARSATL